jgi:tRNA (cmo5U34)-methyltransferase
LHQLSESGFDRVASFYDPLAQLVFRDAQKQAQKELLPFIQANTQVLLIGGGSGWLLQQLLLTEKKLHIVYIDASPKMIRRAQHFTHTTLKSSSASVEFRTGTEQCIKPGETFDSIFTPFLLDLFPEERLTVLMRRLKEALHKDGRWLFVDFWPVQEPAPIWQQLLLKAMYVFFRVFSGIKARRLPDFKAHFERLNLAEIFSAKFYNGMIQAKVFCRQTA